MVPPKPAVAPDVAPHLAGSPAFSYECLDTASCIQSARGRRVKNTPAAAPPPLTLTSAMQSANRSLHATARFHAATGYVPAPDASLGEHILMGTPPDLESAFWRADP